MAHLYKVLLIHSLLSVGILSFPISPVIVPIVCHNSNPNNCHFRNHQNHYGAARGMNDSWITHVAVAGRNIDWTNRAVCKQEESKKTRTTTCGSTSKSISEQNRNVYLHRHSHDSRRRSILSRMAFCLGSPVMNPIAVTASTVVATTATTATTVWAYEPDPDPVQESLYLLCRVQEATVLQERYINKQQPPIQKMKLTLRLVERSYRVMDQINSLSKLISNTDDLVVAVQAGNEAAESLQDAIDFVKRYDTGSSSSTSMTKEQRDFLISALTTTRERLFDFVSYLPDQSKLTNARKRVEEENRLNREEFDPDLEDDAGVFKPIVLPWATSENNGS